jgi:nucleoside-triphosphatase THEP1
MVEAPRAVILTGERGVGKTMLCLALAALSPRYTGLVSPPLLDGAGTRVGFVARCLATGVEWVLGRSDRELGGPRFGRFSFSSIGIARSVDCLRGVLSSTKGPGGAAETAGKEGLAAHARPSRDDVPRPVVIVDEIGPLELGEGLAPVLPLLAGAGHLLLVVRSSLADKVEAFVPRHDRVRVMVTPENRTSLASSVDARFG